MIRRLRTLSGSGSGSARPGALGGAALAALLSALLWSLALAPAASADTLPVLTDTTTGSTHTTAVGDLVTLVPGTYAGPPAGAIQDNWYDCNSANPTPPALGQPPVGCTAITPVTPTTYVVMPADAGYYITVFETDSATMLTNQVASNTLAVPAPPTNIAAPSIAGTSTTGSTLTAVTGLWTGSGNADSYTWFRCDGDGSACAQVSTAATYQLTDSDLGAILLLTQTATNAGGSRQATSPPFGPITTPARTVPPPDPPAPGGAVPTVSGTPQIDATLTATRVTMTNNPSYAYQWLRCSGQACAAIPGATATTYSPGAADLGDALVFSETGSNAGGSGQAQSARTAVVTAPTETTLQITPAGVVAGQPATLIATVTSATGQAPPTGAVTFEQGTNPVAGCASVTTHPSGASATVVCQAVFSGAASALSAVFTPTPGSQLTGSDSNIVGFVLGRAASTATLTVPRHVTLGHRTTLTAQIAPPAGTQGIAPTGTVVFLDGHKAIKGCESALAGGIARCPVKYTSLGTHSITATYLGDGNFSGSSTQILKLAVVVPKPSGYVASLMSWTFLFNPRYTRVPTLAVTGVQPGLTISLGCSGSGCPRHRYVDTVKRSACGRHDRCHSVDLAKRLRGHELGVGARLTVRLTHRGWLGKYYSFVIRHGRKPAIRTACLAVGQTKPGAACTPR